MSSIAFLLNAAPQEFSGYFLQLNNLGEILRSIFWLSKRMRSFIDYYH